MLLLALFVRDDFVWVGGVGGYDQLCFPASPKLLLRLDLGLGCDNISIKLISFDKRIKSLVQHLMFLNMKSYTFYLLLLIPA